VDFNIRLSDARHLMDWTNQDQGYRRVRPQHEREARMRFLQESAPQYNSQRSRRAKTSALRELAQDFQDLQFEYHEALSKSARMATELNISRREEQKLRDARVPYADVIETLRKEVLDLKAGAKHADEAYQRGLNQVKLLGRFRQWQFVAGMLRWRVDFDSEFQYAEVQPTLPFSTPALDNCNHPLSLPLHCVNACFTGMPRHTGSGDWCSLPRQQLASFSSTCLGHTSAVRNVMGSVSGNGHVSAHFSKVLRRSRCWGP